MSRATLLTLVSSASALLLQRCAPPPPWRTAAVRRRAPSSAFRASASAADAEFELALLFSDSETAAFPIPAAFQQERRYRYTFDSPARVRLLQRAEDSGIFGHCVCDAHGDPPAPAAPGTVGVALAVEASERGFGGEVATATVSAASRFVVHELVGTFPFVTARCARLDDSEGDEELAEAEALEPEAEALLARLAALAATLAEGVGGAEEDALAALAAPAALLAAHRQDAAGPAAASTAQRLDGALSRGLDGLGGLPPREPTAAARTRARLERLSLGGCELLALPPATAAKALATTRAAERLRLLIDALKPLATDGVAELDAVCALGPLPGAAARAVGGAPGAPWKLQAAHAAPRLRRPSGFAPIDIPLGAPPGAPPAAPAAPAELPPGSRLEFWWNEEWGWCAATVRGVRRGAGGELLHALEFEGWDGPWEDAALEFGDGGRRWRPLGPRRDG